MVMYGYNVICFGKRIARRRRRFTRGSPRITRFTVCRGFGRPSGGCIPTVSHGTGCKQVRLNNLITMNTCSILISHGITRNHTESHGITRYHTTSTGLQGRLVGRKPVVTHGITPHRQQVNHVMSIDILGQLRSCGITRDHTVSRGDHTGSHGITLLDTIARTQNPVTTGFWVTPVRSMLLQHIISYVQTEKRA